MVSMNPTNTIIHGDCVEELGKLDSKIASLIVADPPYGKILKEKWDQIETKEHMAFTESWLTECHRVLKDNGSIYVWCSLGERSVPYWLNMVSCLSNIFTFKDMVIWSKQRGRGNRRGWLCTREEIIWCVKNKKDFIWNKEKQHSKHKYHDSWIKRLGKENNPYKRATNVWTDIDEVTIKQSKNRGSKGKRTTLHPTQKPVEAIQRLILSHTQENDLVVDPFGGSGTTAIASKEINRKFILIEKDKNYVDVSRQRLNERSL